MATNNRDTAPAAPRPHPGAETQALRAGALRLVPWLFLFAAVLFGFTLFFIYVPR